MPACLAACDALRAERQFQRLPRNTQTFLGSFMSLLPIRIVVVRVICFLFSSPLQKSRRLAGAATEILLQHLCERRVLDEIVR